MAIRSTDALSAGTWAIDPAHSRIAVTFQAFRTTAVHGTFGEFAGELIVDDDSTASIWSEIQLDSFTTGNDSLDSRLRGFDFRSADRRPTAVFTSRVFRAVRGPVVVPGRLMVYGTSIPMRIEIASIDVRVGIDAAPKANLMVVSVVNRRALGNVTMVPETGYVLPDRIALTAGIELVRAPTQIAI
ncbi:YceI family protein [Nocardia brasiliensis]